jgi:hypothetical protein
MDMVDNIVCGMKACRLPEKLSGSAWCTKLLRTYPSSLIMKGNPPTDPLAIRSSCLILDSSCACMSPCAFNCSFDQARYWSFLSTMSFTLTMCSLPTISCFDPFSCADSRLIALNQFCASASTKICSGSGSPRMLTSES